MTSVPASAQEASDPALDPNDAQPDFYVTTLPTTLRLPVHKLGFRLTHRFGRPLGQGSFGDLAGDLFGLDSGAQVGLELRYGLVTGGQFGVYRTSNKTIQFFGQYSVLSQPTHGLGVDVVANVDGTNNFRDDYSPGVALVLSRELGGHGALYFEPAWIGNSNLSDASTNDDQTFVAGVGARARLRKNTYVVVEVSPRLAGYQPGAALISFGIEQRAGGHLFQLNFSNGIDTTLAQVARGGTSYKDWYIGFNLTRKFY
ncbi:MAG: DUF5777 family beta-barrel protein [Acidobacteriota bacterium]|nr:DUF5777 family beta-barrel protein [Acidobacteriota bacterium]